MLIPQEFKDLCAHFHQDIFLVHLSLDDAIADAVGALGRRQRAVVREFLSGALGEPHDDGELERAWNETPTQLLFRNAHDVRAVFQSIHDAVERADREPF